MELVLEMHDVDMKAGDTVKVKGFIYPEADRFAINLGSAETELALHFDPRFEYGDDVRVIVLNTREDGVWGTEQKEKAFPFEKGADFQVSITFHGDVFMIKLTDDSVLTFPNRTLMDTMTLLLVEGKIGVKTLEFDYDPPRYAKGCKGQVAGI